MHCLFQTRNTSAVTNTRMSDYNWTHRSMGAVWFAESAEAGPLVPAACALALMPRSAADLAPTALRHLMQAGPPIGDLFDTCAECESLMGTQYSISAVRPLMNHLHNSLCNPLYNPLHGPSYDQPTNSGKRPGWWLIVRISIGLDIIYTNWYRRTDTQ